MELLIPDWPDAPPQVGALSTLRSGGFSIGPYGDGVGGGGLNLGLHVQDDLQQVSRNRRLLRSILPAEPVWLEQVHGCHVVTAEHVAPVPQADACVAASAGAVCAVMTADCLPVLFCDLEGRTVAAAHAGWRGLAGGVLERTVAAMHARGAGQILAWLGPAIGARQFEVGADVVQAFVNMDRACQAAFVPMPGRDGKYLADIYQLARHRLAQAGVTRVSGGDYCTVSAPERFYSYRRDRVTGRMASLIWLK